MTRPKRSLSWILAAAAVVAVPAHAQVKSKLAVGVILPISGAMGSFGGEVMRGIEFAMTELKEKDADLATRIEINVEDSQSQTKLSDTLARKLVATRRADILLGALTSSVTYGLAKISSEVQRPLIVPTAGHPGLTNMGPNVFRTCSADDDQGRALAKHGLTGMQKKQAAIVFEKSSSYGRAIAAAFEKAWLAGGGKVVLKKEFEPGANMREIARQVKKTDAEVLLAPINYAEAAKLIDGAKEEGARYKILGSDSWDSPKLWSLASKASMKGHFFATQFTTLDSNPDTLNFVGAFQSRYKAEPTILSAQGYDAMQVVFDVFRRARSNMPNAILKALAATIGVPSSGGPIAIDAQRNAKKSWKIMSTATSAAAFVARVEVDE